MGKPGKLYVMGVDQMILPLTKRMVEEGAAPTLAKLMARGSVYKALASYPCYTPNNWQSIATGANTGTPGVRSWFVHMPDGEDVSSLTSWRGATCSASAPRRRRTIPPRRSRGRGSSASSKTGRPCARR